MSKFIKQTKKTVAQIARMPYSAYQALAQLGRDHNAEIAKADNGWLTLTFDEAKTAKNVAQRFEADYTAAHEARVAASAPAPAKETKPTKPTVSKKGSAKVSKAIKTALAPYAGKGKSANHAVADVLRAKGIVPNGAEWDYWTTIR